jgi:tetratricopeptide (TPR) repeat protein
LLADTRCEISKDARFAKLIQAKGVTRKMIGRDVHLQGLEFFKENQYENAAKWLREALTLDPTAERWSDWASAELACGRAEQAEAGYRQALKLDLDNGEAALNLGALYATSGRAAEALGWLERGMLAANETQQKLACKLQEQCRSMLATTRTAPAKPSALTEFCRAITGGPYDSGPDKPRGKHHRSWQGFVPKAGSGGAISFAEERHRCFASN